MPYRVMTVCTGNICRSPIAEVVLRDRFAEAGLADLSLDRRAIDCKVSQVGKKLLGTVLALNELEEVLGVVDELMSIRVNCSIVQFVLRGSLTDRSPGLPTNEDVVSQETE